MTRRQRGRAVHGFTLVELLAAIAVLALLALMSWRGIDGLLRTQQAVRERMDGVSVLQTGLAQWNADLQAMVELPPFPAVDFDGRVLRLVRVDASLPGSPVRVVGWSRRMLPQAHQGRGSWARWQSAPLRDPQALAQAWQQAQQWAEQPGPGDADAQVAVVGLEGWQLLYFRNNAWSNPLSSAGADSATPGSGTPAPSGPPDGIRLVLRLAGPPLSGELTRDWMRPATPGGDR